VGGFEAHLSRYHADFAIRLERSELGASARERLAALARGPDSGAWQRIVELLDSDSVHDLWLEFDGDAGGSDLPVPSVFAGPSDSMGGGGAAATEVAQWVRLIAGEGAPVGATSTAERLVGSLPPEGSVFQIGSMLARPDRGLRLLVRGLEPPAIAAYLEQIQWPGDRDAVAESAASWHRFTSSLYLSLDAGPRVGPRLGLELMFHDSVEVSATARCERLLGALEKRGLCSRPQREALLSWRGVSTRSNTGDRWPPGLDQGASLFQGSLQPVLARGLNHVKIVFETDRPTEAKAYFGYQLLWLRSDRPER